MREVLVIRPKNMPLVSGTQFAAIVVLTIALSLIVDFGRRTTVGLYVSQAQERLEQEIDALLEQQEALKAHLEEVKTDAYVERWAREQAHMVLPGDRLVILVTPAAPAAQQDADAQASASAQPFTSPSEMAQAPNWHQWWRLFLDSEPGTLRRR
jgi:cell division protein FtsB